MDDPKLIRVLLSAYACEPGKGSEPGVGWNMARELSSRVRLTVITRPNNRQPIEASGAAWISEVRWVYWDPPRWLTFWKKRGRGVQLFYILWQAGICRPIRRLMQQESYDVIHHLTFGKYWVPSSLARLGVPFVFGPVGGGEASPPGLGGGGSLRGHLAEFSKKCARSFVAWFPPIRRLLHKAAWTFAATPQTENALRAAGVTRLSVLPQSGISPADFPAVPLPDGTYEDACAATFRLITASRLIHWKAVDLAFEAVASLPPDLNVRLYVLQEGPEMGRLRKLAASLGISERVEFKGKLPSLAEAHSMISQADALIHPALHEAFGQACIEALALGTPVICLDWAGPGMIVNELSGIAVAPGNRKETIQRLAEAIQILHREKSEGMTRKADCIARACGSFQWTHLADQIESVYHRIGAN
jgi:glycosyltransferase involved in cell wall biosynthesis